MCAECWWRRLTLHGSGRTKATCGAVKVICRRCVLPLDRFEIWNIEPIDRSHSASINQQQFKNLRAWNPGFSFRSNSTEGRRSAGRLEFNPSVLPVAHICIINQFFPSSKNPTRLGRSGVRSLRTDGRIENSEMKNVECREVQFKFFIYYASNFWWSLGCDR